MWLQFILKSGIFHDKKSLSKKNLAVFQSAQLISFTRHEHAPSDHLIQGDNMCTMMHHNLICSYIKIIKITSTTYILQSYLSFHLRQS